MRVVFSQHVGVATPRNHSKIAGFCLGDVWESGLWAHTELAIILKFNWFISPRRVFPYYIYNWTELTKKIHSIWLAWTWLVTTEFTVFHIPYRKKIFIGIWIFRLWQIRLCQFRLILLNFNSFNYKIFKYLSIVTYIPIIQKSEFANISYR